MAEDTDDRRRAETLLERSLRDEHRPVSLPVRGGCMSPFLLDGDVVRIRPEAADARPGDIVLARGASGELVCHRLLARGPETAEVAGDRSAIESLPHAAILGRVVEARRGRRVIDFRTDPGRRLDPLLANLRRHAVPGSSTRWLAVPLRRMLLRARGISWYLATSSAG